MLSCLSKVFSCKFYCQVSEDDDEHGQASLVYFKQKNREIGGHDGVARGKNEHTERYNVTCSDKEDEKQTVHPEFEFFWSENNPFSQWYRTKFIVEEHQFSTAEQYMMYQKAKLFSDDEMAKKILTEVIPKKQKKLGRQVKNFKPELWKDNCIRIVKAGNRNKFFQNEDLKNHLFSTYPKILVEASPYDKIWGIGRDANDSKAQTKETWLGHNLLGYALTDVRNKMMMEEGIITSDEHVLTSLAESALKDIKKTLR
ncbi:hypothetical protein CHS0354_042136 [Potamilus streckersoni]|uniref:NADAR domain-containing protein n=1 Tax=Potamilus streckersoni TaxID=2493646 RepID=A0AAE0TM02_9BIVA|nr:hypothetical protein CHS0354_042136 [Potamilus streckersoni]